MKSMYVNTNNYVPTTQTTHCTPWKSIASVVMALFVVLSSLFATMSPSVNPQNTGKLSSVTTTPTAQAFDATQFVMCMWGSDAIPGKIYQATQSSDLYFQTQSKSAINFGTDRVDSGLNTIMALFGNDYNKVNKDVLGVDIDSTTNAATDDNKEFNKGAKVNPFDRFGVSGLKFTSYLGEWRYIVIDACGGGEPQDPQANLYYEGRLDPQSTWEDISRSQDIRTQQFSKSFASQYWTSLSNIIANGLFTVTKTMVAFTVSLINISFTDLGEELGINKVLFGEGTEYDGGIFGALNKSFFQPLVYIMFTITGVWLVYSGLFKSQHRRSFTTLARGLAMFVLAIFVFAFASTIVPLPNKIAVGAQAIMVNTLNQSLDSGGDLCNTDVGSKDFSLANDKAESNVELMESVGKNTSSAVGCVFWETFLVKPWSQAQFGTDWNNLWANDKMPKGAKDAHTLGNENGEWVGDAAVPLGKDTYINNWAIFQISTQTNAHSPIGQDGQLSKYTSGVANDWWRIVDAVSNYTETGKRVQISGSGGGGGGSGKWVKPADGSVTSGFGPRSLGDTHLGIDFADSCGSPVYAASDGEVKFVGKEAMGGNAILISHGDVDTLYVHMQEGANKVKEGDQVKAGDLISEIGNTGMSYGCHLHFEVRDPATGNWASFDKTKDPAKFLKDNGVDLDIASDAEGGSPSGGNNGGGDVTVATPNPANPTEPWDVWSGNASVMRMGVSASSILVAMFGLAAPFMFSLLSAMAAIGLSIIMAFAPVMLLFGVGVGRFFEIFKSWVELVVQLTLYRIVLGMLMVLSIILTMTAIEKMETVGWWQGVLMLIALSLLMLSARKKVWNVVKSASFASHSFRNTMDTMTCSVMKQGSRGAKVASAGLVGGVAAQSRGGNFARGSLVGVRTELTHQTYQNRHAREFLTSYENMRSYNNRSSINNSQQFCARCGNKLVGTNVVAGRDGMGNFYCQTCLDDNMVPEGTREVVYDFDRINNAPQGMNERAKYSTKRRETTLNSKGAQELKSALVNGNIKTTPENVLQALLKHVSYDVNNAREDLARGEFTSIDVKIPAELEGYLDKNLIAQAWSEGRYEYIQTAFAIAYATWLEKEHGYTLTKDIDSIVSDTIDFTENEYNNNVYGSSQGNN